MSFHWLDEPCVTPPTLEFDVIVDVFFLLDIMVTLGTGVHHGGEYVDDMKAVGKMYLKGWFIFDLLTSFPVSFFELAVDAACKGKREGLNMVVDATTLRLVRSLKPIRWFKIMRIAKLAKAGKYHSYYAVRDVQKDDKFLRLENLILASTVRTPILNRTKTQGLW